MLWDEEADDDETVRMIEYKHRPDRPWKERYSEDADLDDVLPDDHPLEIEVRVLVKRMQNIVLNEDLYNF